MPGDIVSVRARYPVNGSRNTVYWGLGGAMPRPSSYKLLDGSWLTADGEVADKLVSDIGLFIFSPAISIIPFSAEIS